MTTLGHLVARWTLAAGAVIAPVAIISSGGTTAQTASLAGSQGTDTSIAATESAVTVRGRGDFADLEITINQTRNLANQTVSITWRGGMPTQGTSRAEAHYLQIFQCWGDDDGAVPGNPGPPPEQCVQGAVAGLPGGGPNGTIVPSGAFVLDRIIGKRGWDPLPAGTGVQASDGLTWLPFRAVDGRTADIQYNTNFRPGIDGNFWLNPFYDAVTTNEIGLAPTAPDGSGAALLELNTGVESSGLGCGQNRQRLPDGTTKVPQCWIVIVPRGAPATENANTRAAPEGTEIDETRFVMTSPVGPQAWPNRIAVPIEFNPVDSPCDINADARQISGTELAVPAVVSWQPVLCGGGDLPPYTYARAADSAARLQLSRGTAAMAVVSRPGTPSSDPLKKVVYAPLTASGVVIGFNIERSPSVTAPDDAQVLRGVRVAELNLTPRLVAKLLTSSYANQVNILFRPSGYEWVQNNPLTLYSDPDFLRFNPEFTQFQVLQGRTLSGLNLPTGNSDAARQLWQWILADPEAKAWLDGTADQWGMLVNPAYATVTAGTPESFPKADPYCYQPERVTAVPEPYTPPQLCTVDWNPPATGFADAAVNTRRAFDNARIGEDLSNPPLQASAYWRRTQPQAIGQKAFLSVTDTASAAQYGIQTARLSRAGDNGDDRVFIAADVAGLTAGVGAMEPDPVAGLLEAVPLEQPADAYPLTVVTYAAISPLTLDAAARSDYAAFIEYAASTGQTAGTEPGELPRGYATLPQALRDQALAAAAEVRTMTPPASTTTTTTTTVSSAASTTVATTTATNTGGGSNQNPVVTSTGSPGNTGNGSGSTSSGTTTTTTTTVPASTVPPVDSTVPPTSEPEAAPATTEPPVVESAPPTSAPVAVTPEADVTPLRYAVAGFAGTGLLAALVALEITKLPRRRLGAPLGEQL